MISHESACESHRRFISLANAAIEAAWICCRPDMLPSGYVFQQIGDEQVAICVVLRLPAHPSSSRLVIANEKDRRLFPVPVLPAACRPPRPEKA
jgi:hypothetical protein